MHINPRHWLIIGLTVLTLNVLTAGLLERFVSYELEKAIYDQHNQYLLTVQSDVNQQFAMTPQTQWQAKALELEIYYDAAATILPRTAEGLDPIVLEKLAQPQSRLGYVDLETTAIYFPLDEQNVLELGPVPFKSALVYFADYLPWLAAILLNCLLLFTFIKWQQTQLTDTMALLSPIAIEPEGDIESYFRKIANHVNEMEDSNLQRLTLQRDLLHGVAHEFRSPMARIQFALDMLDDAAPDERIQLQKSMTSALFDLDALVKELLYFIRLKDDNLALKTTSLSIQETAQAAIDKVQPFYPHIEFQLRSTEDVEFVADQNLILRMLVNLLRNAGRFANRQCRIHWQLTEGRLLIQVEDDGIGIPPGKTTRIFEPFTRLDPSRSRDSGGCGLGLAIVASIVTKHQGRISVLPHETADTKLSGACFLVQLPQAKPWTS